MTSDDMARTAKDTAKDLADEAGASAEKAADTVKGHAATMGERAKDLAGQASDTASDIYGRATDTLSKAANSLPGSTADAMAKGQSALESGSGQVADRVKKQPVEALLLAAAIGYLVGWATNRS